MSGGWFTGFAIGLNLGSAALHIVLSARYRKRIREIQNGHRQSGQNLGSAAGATLDPQLTAISAALLSGGTTSAGDGASAEPVAEEIVAWRGWALGQDERGPVLWSLVKRCKWDGPTLVADKLPTKGNEHGIYALSEQRADIAAQPVVGLVALSGLVVEGKKGFRGERATIRSLRLRALPDTAPSYREGSGTFQRTVGGGPQAWRKRSWDIAAQLADRYQCECEVDWLPTSALPAEELNA